MTLVPVEPLDCQDSASACAFHACASISADLAHICKDTSVLNEGDAIVIELGREIFGARKVASATFARSLRQFGRPALVDLVALMGNYAAAAALLTAFDMQLDPDQVPALPVR